MDLAPHLAGDAVQAGDLVLNPASHRVEAAGRLLELGPTEFRLLQFLMTKCGRVQPRQTLLTEVWDYTEGVDSRTVDTHIRRLRRKLGPEAERIETIVGVGYRFRS